MVVTMSKVKAKIQVIWAIFLDYLKFQRIKDKNKYIYKYPKKLTNGSNPHSWTVEELSLSWEPQENIFTISSPCLSVTSDTTKKIEFSGKDQDGVSSLIRL